MNSAKIDTMSQPDEHLVEALTDDLDTGFIALFHAHRAVVFSTALRITGRWADAEDLTAEAFLRAYRALTGYHRDRIQALRPRSWLLTIVINLWRNSQRDAARRPVAVPAEQAPDPPDPQDVQRTVDERETDRELAELLAVLPADQRAAVVLRHVVDLPVAEVAVVLGRPAGTVKSQISRGLHRLRELYPAAEQRGLVPSDPTEVRR
ncbi:MAG TPA: RNA polymerase sigma factor [Pseudonocardiaceae bacterium]|nr:RNA polymerase sigma factor [Pseudonocardiaceae bacterium]